MPTFRNGRRTSRASRAGRDRRAPLAVAPDGATAPSGIRIWLMAARPRTLPAAASPVFVGTALAVPVGLLAAAILVVNNVRDSDTDRRAGKRTLAVRLGRARSRTMFASMIYAAYPLSLVTWIFGPTGAWLLLPWLTLPLAARVVRTVRNRTDGASLNDALAKTGMLLLTFCVLLSVGLLLSR